MHRALERLGSLRLALVLLLALAAVGALGSALPQGLEAAEVRERYPALAEVLLALGLTDFYRGPLFRGLLALFTINLLACGMGRSRVGWHAFRGRGAGSVRLPLGDREGWAERLRAAGFRVTCPAPLAARRQGWAFLGFPLTHLSLPLILAGGLWGSLGGFVGTQNVHVGQSTPTVYDWAEEAPTALPWVLHVDDFELRHHPTLLRLSVAGPQGPATEVAARVGARVAVPGTAYAVHLHAFDAAGGDLSFSVEGPGGPWGPLSRATADQSPVRLTPVAFKDPEVSRAAATVSLRRADGAVVARQAVAVNHPLVHDGYRIFLTAWGEDAQGFPFAGFQLVRDPGQPLLWTGTFALIVGLAGLFLGDGAWAREEGEVLVLQSSRGRKRLGALLGPFPEPPPTG